MKKKDIYTKLNYVKMDINKIDKVELNDLEKKRIFKEVVAKEKKFKRKKRAIIAASSIALVGLVLLNSGAREIAATGVNNIMEMLNINAKNDFKEIVDSTSSSNGVDMTLVEVKRDNARIYVRYKLTFEDDISSWNELVTPGSVDKRTGIFYEKPFSDSKIFLNGQDCQSLYVVEKEGVSDQEENPILREDFWSVLVNDVEMTDHYLIQEAEIFLNDEEYSSDLDIKLDFRNIKIGDKTIEGPWEINYTMKNDQYSNIEEVKKVPLNIEYKCTNSNTINIKSYANSNTGLKIYADAYGDVCYPIPFEGEETSLDIPIIRFEGVDNLGNKYLLYPIWNGSRKMTFHVYSGPADSNNEYKDYLDENATTLTIALYEQVIENDWPSFIKATDDIVIDLTKVGE